MNERYLHRLSRPVRGGAAVAEAVPPVSVSKATPPVTELVVVTGDEAASRARAKARRRRVGACEVCGRTLLTGEQPREIVLLERSVWACPLCVIDSQTTAQAPGRLTQYRRAPHSRAFAGSPAALCGRLRSLTWRSAPSAVAFIDSRPARPRNPRERSGVPVPLLTLLGIRGDYENPHDRARTARHERLQHDPAPAARTPDHRRHAQGRRTRRPASTTPTSRRSTGPTCWRPTSSASPRRPRR